jgi:hypothetical protein
MKKRKIEVLESISVNPEPSYHLLPNLISDIEQKEIKGGLARCNTLYDDPCYGICIEFTVTACAFKISCNVLYEDGGTMCQGCYTGTEPCRTA